MVSSAIRSQHYFAVNLPASDDIVCKPNIFIIIGTCNCAVDVFNIVCIQYHVLCACIFNATNSNWSVQCVFSIGSFHVKSNNICTSCSKFGSIFPYILVFI